MKRLFARLQITKKKMGVVALSSALFLTMGASLSFAASNQPVKSDSKKPNVEVNKCAAIPKGKDKEAKIESNSKKPNQSERTTLITQSKNGVTQYSLDGGKTWVKSLKGVKHVKHDNGKTVTVYTTKKPKTAAEEDMKKTEVTNDTGNEKGFDCITEDDGKKSPLPPKPQLKP